VGRLGRVVAVAPLLLVVWLGVATATPRNSDDSAVETAGHSLDMGTAPRVSVDTPTKLIPLLERDKRIHRLTPFQSLVDAAPAGSTLRPKPGLYAGPVHLTKKLVIDGGGQVTIDGGDKGTVFVLETSGATVRGLHLTGSGSSFDTDDACLNVRGSNNTVENLVIDNCLSGIDLKQSNNNIVRGNRIRSKVAELGVRGDGLRLWYSMNNRIEGNTVVDSRDMVAWYSNGNLYLNNYGARSRYSLHFMFANNNVVAGNRFYDNAVGVYLMYTENTTIRNNVISHSNGPTGMGIGFKESSATLVEGNEIIYNALGLSADLSPFQPDTKIILKNNRIAYNGIAINFNSSLENYEVTGNTFEGNITNLAVAAGGNARGNLWRGNYWDDYQGFDRNNDGVGDMPYELYAYADRIWMEVPYARFFKNAPLMEAIDFLEKLAPFSSPELMLRDDAPLFHKPARART
jgi:nitrous oxidase accessory protein